MEKAAEPLLDAVEPPERTSLSREDFSSLSPLPGDLLKRVANRRESVTSSIHSLLRARLARKAFGFP
jgi:hypothetical protein